MGLVQVTWEANGKKFGAQSPADLLSLPVALRALFDGMLQGMFTGKKLLHDFYLSDKRPHQRPPNHQWARPGRACSPATTTPILAALTTDAAPSPVVIPPVVAPPHILPKPAPSKAATAGRSLVGLWWRPAPRQ